VEGHIEVLPVSFMFPVINFAFLCGVGGSHSGRALDMELRTFALTSTQDNLLFKV